MFSVTFTATCRQGSLALSQLKELDAMVLSTALMCDAKVIRLW